MTRFVPGYDQIEQPLRTPIARLDEHAPQPSDGQLCEESGVSCMKLYAAVYRAVAAGEPGDGYPTFRDGHWENVLADAVLVSNDERRWVRPHSVEVP